MCRPAPCRTCGKTTWVGCGMHIDSIKARVPADQWCGGHRFDEPLLSPPLRGRTAGPLRRRLAAVLGRRP